MFKKVVLLLLAPALIDYVQAKQAEVDLDVDVDETALNDDDLESM